MSQWHLFPLGLFLFMATVQDAHQRGVERMVFVVWGAFAVVGWAVGLWSLYAGGALLGYGLARLAGLPSGDRLGGALVGLFLGAVPVAGAFSVALVITFIWWRRWGALRSPADFAFYPFLSVGVGGMVVVQILRG